MATPHRVSLRFSLCVASIVLTAPLAFLACRDEPTASRASRPSAQVILPDTTLPGGGITLQGALAGKLPSTDTVTSSVPAFEIKQKGGGIAGRFEITNSASAAIALDGVNGGSGHALLAWNLGLGRGAVIITSNSNNTLPTLDVSAASSGAAADIRANNASSTNPAVKGTTLGLGPASFFMINNASNASVAVDATTNGTGQGGRFQITNAANASAALSATTAGTGVAGLFQLSNASNSSAALSASTAGTGLVGRFENTNAANTSSVLSLITNSSATPLLVDHNGPAPANLAVFRSAGANTIRFTKNGKGIFNAGTQTGGADLAEAFAVEGDRAAYGPGDVLVISATSDRTVEKSREPYSTAVAGVFATKPGVLLTERGVDDELTDLVPLGVVGVIPTKVSAENGPIHRRDLLVTARTPGHAMLGTDRGRLTGAIIGRALEDFAGPGTGVIKVLVSVR